MPDLTDEELREAAEEAGISPGQLRQALAVRDGPTLPTQAQSMLPAAPRGESTRHAEAQVGHPPEQAVLAVQRAIERDTGARGHRQGDDGVSIVDERAGMTFHVTAQPEAGGSIVRVDIDGSAERGAAALTGMLAGGTALVLVGLGWLLSTPVALAGVGLGLWTGWHVTRRLASIGAKAERSRDVAARALVEADPPKSLPAAGD